MKKYVIIVAGGSGSRMKSNLPKQFIPIGGKPILMHTIEAFHRADTAIHLIVVLPEAQMTTWQTLCTQYNFSLVHALVSGGDSRFQSVKNGLSSINEEGLVAIHDGVRPFIPTEIISESYRIAQEKGNAVTCIPVKDSLRKLTNQGTAQKNVAVDRSQFVAIQTPQTFRLELIKAAFSQPESHLFTDDATVLEAWGEEINLIAGSNGNFKITTQVDLLLAENALKFLGEH